MSTVTGRARVGLLVSAACGLLGAYLLSPAATAVHVEGLSAQLQSLSLALRGEGIASHDPYLPLVSEFLFLKSPGVVDLLAVLRGIPGISGDIAFRLLTIVSLGLLLMASARFARAWGAVRAAPAFAALILTPGVIDSGFFFNDNIVSAAFAAASLAVLVPAAGGWRHLLSGALAAMAALCRLDGLLALPFLVGLVLIDPSPRPRAVRLAALVAGWLIILAISAAINGATLIDSLTIGRYFGYARATGFDFRVTLFALVYFFGLITPLLLFIGAVQRSPQGTIARRWLDVGFFVGYPLLLCGIALVTGREVRYLHPLLSPVIALHGGRGVEWVLQQMRRPATQRRTGLLVLLSAVTAVTFLIPPAIVSVADGPRSLVGRLWSAVLWWRWQQGVELSMARLDELTDALDREPTPLVLTSAWNAEFFVHMKLAERGYRSTSAAESIPGCDGFSVYTRGPHRVLHLRLHNEFYLVPYDHTTYGALAANRASECPALAAVSGAWITTFGSKGEKWIDPALTGFGYERFHQPLEETFAHDWLRQLVTRRVQTKASWCCSDGLIDAVKLTPTELSAIFANARVIAAASADAVHTTPLAMFNAGREANRGRTKLTRDRWP